MAKRIRACGAVILKDQILMVRHVHDGRDYWTLPGGGVHPNEPPERAAEREVLEETGVAVVTERLLFTTTDPGGRNATHCFLMSEPEDQGVSTGVDPEEAHLAPEDRMLQDVKWHTLESMRYDVQVSRVLQLLNQDDADEDQHT